jgi:putative spermidine/putrescine transport system substrate-binding protein
MKFERDMDRRRFLTGMGATALGTTLIASVGGRQSIAADAGTLTIVSYGAGYQEAQTKAFFNPFAAAHNGVVIRQDTPTSNAKLKAMVEAGAVTWDIALVDDSFGLDADAQWLEPIDYSVVDKSSFLPGYAGTYRIGADVEATVLAYRADKFPSGTPNSYADYFDLTKFPGKRGAWKYASGGIFEAALIADGVPADKLYPLDIDRALKKLSTIKDDLVWWETGAQSEQLLTSGEVSIDLLWISRALHAAETAAVKIGWGQWTTQNGYWVVPKGTKNKKLAMEALAYFSSEKAQIEFTKYMPYGPTNKNAVGKEDARYKADLPTSHLDTRVVVDVTWWNKNQADVDSKFQEWLLQ